MRLKLFKGELENWGTKSWEREKELEKKYNQILRELFLLLDHFGIFLNGKMEQGGIESIYDRARQILSNRGIEEMPVKKGDCFNGKYHKCLDAREDRLEKGTVLEVVRKGYLMKNQAGEDDVVLRPSEVIISCGSSDNETEHIKEDDGCQKHSEST